jgi:hypothetical protein
MRRSGALACALTCALTCAPNAAVAQGRTVTLTGPAGDPLRESTPGFTITTSGFVQEELPLQLTLQVSTTPDFSGILFSDTTVAGSSASIVVPRLLPQRISVWWRVRVRTALGTLVVSDAVGPRQTPAWLTLVTPNGRNGSTVDTRRPTFIWSSAGLRPPVKPWNFRIVISRTSDGSVEFNGSTSDSTFTMPVELQSNTSYRWSVTSAASTGDTIRVASFASFVILDPNVPVATVLYQNFPNPFPTALVPATCIWFDLRNQSDIALEVLDLRGNHVATILPGRSLGGTLPPGRYGRAAINTSSGCDSRLTWDGTTDGGREVPPGVYLLRLKADGMTSQRKMLFKGRGGG